jgi:hypothetical protein
MGLEYILLLQADAAAFVGSTTNHNHDSNILRNGGGLPHLA